MTLEQPKTMARRAIEASWNEHNHYMLDQIAHPNLVDHTHSPVRLEGLDKFKQTVAWFHIAMPDGHFTIEDEIAEGNKVVHRWRIRGTHRGTFMNLIPPTGRHINVTGITISRFEHGRIVERWGNFDELSLIQQMGATISLGRH